MSRFRNLSNDNNQLKKSTKTHSETSFTILDAKLEKLIEPKIHLF